MRRIRPGVVPRRTGGPGCPGAKFAEPDSPLSVRVIAGNAGPDSEIGRFFGVSRQLAAVAEGIGATAVDSAADSCSMRFPRCNFAARLNVARKSKRS